jgi:hypothetical protein
MRCGFGMQSLGDFLALDIETYPFHDLVLSQLSYLANAIEQSVTLRSL